MQLASRSVCYDSRFVTISPRRGRRLCRGKTLIAYRALTVLFSHALVIRPHMARLGKARGFFLLEIAISISLASSCCYPLSPPPLLLLLLLLLHYHITITTTTPLLTPLPSSSCSLYIAWRCVAVHKSRGQATTIKSPSATERAFKSFLCMLI